MLKQFILNEHGIGKNFNKVESLLSEWNKWTIAELVSYLSLVIIDRENSRNIRHFSAEGANQILKNANKLIISFGSIFFITVGKLDDILFK